MIVTAFKTKTSPYWHLRWRENGRKHVKNTGIRHEGARTPDPAGTVNEIRRTIEDRIARLRFGLAPGVESVEMSAFCNDWISKQTQLRGSSSMRVSFALKQWLDYCKTAGISTVNQVTPSVIVSYRDHRAQTVSGSTVKLELAIISKLLKDAAAQNHIQFDINPAKLKVKIEPKLVQPFSDTEIQDLLSMPAPPWMHTAIQIALYTGARIGSITDLMWEHVDFDRGTIFFSSSKTTPYAVPMPEALKAHLLPLKSTGPVMPKWLHEARQGYASEQFRYVAAKNGIQGAHFHKFRHTYVSKLANSGVPTGVRQLLANHRTQNINVHYTHAAAAELLQHVNGLNYQVTSP